MEQDFRRKKRLTFAVMVWYMFLTGSEYAIIVPSAWAYLQSLGVTEEYMYGFVLSAYSLSMGVAGVLGGRLADIYMHQTKSVVLISVAIMTIGNFQYAFGMNITNILLSRLLCGIGSAAQSAMTAEICRVTEVEERTPILAICNAAKQLGLFIAPAVQLLFSYCHFKVYGDFEVNPLNAAGWFMGALWVVFCIATIAMYHNLTAEYEKIKDSTRKDNGRLQTLTMPTQKESLIADEEPIESAPKVLQDTDKANFDVYMDEFLTETFVLLQFLVFTLYFCAVSQTTVITIIMQEYFDCTVWEISWVYMGGGIAAMLVYSTVALVSRHIRDSTLQLIGVFTLMLSLVWLSVVIPLTEQGRKIHVGFYTSGIILMLFAYPIASIANNGLSAKVVSNRAQGLGQGLRRLLGSLGMILAPLWGGSTVKRPYWLLGVPIAILSLNGVMLILTHTQLRRAENKLAVASKEQKPRVKDQERDETQPLLSNSH